MSEWTAGTNLGPYTLESVIGQGGMGQVWKARDTRLSRVVAIKRVNEKHSARFEQEALAIAALNHPHICTLFDIGPDYLVMEYVAGSLLKGPLPAEEALKLARQIASALEAAHAKGILHRDLKPGNVMVTSTGVKLLDFGLAKIMDPEASGDATQTMEGTIAGTAAYMSPEQARGDAVDARSDIFSFGSVLYELLAGRRAFTGTSTADILSAVLRDEPRELAAPADLVRIVQRCLRKQRENRYSSSAEVSAALEDAKFEDAAQRSIAVLPFANMSRDPDDEYFSDGLAEEILNALVKVSGLKVIARTSAFAFKGQNTDIRKIAEMLGVATVLEGSVRRSGNRIRVTAQLITAADGSHLWSERYDREMADVFAVQDEISAAITAALRLKLSPATAAKPRYTPKLAAYEAVLRGRHEMQRWTPESLLRTKALYLHAIEIDPQYALARCELALDYFQMATGNQIPPPEAAKLMGNLAEEALAIDPSLSEPHAVLALVAVLDYQWEQAAQHFRSAFSRESPSPMVIRLYSTFFLAPTGRQQEAVAQLESALSQDPLSMSLRIDFAFLQSDDLSRERMLLRLLETDPDAWIPSSWLAPFYQRQGDLEKARMHGERCHALVPTLQHVTGSLAAILSVSGENERARELLKELGTGEAAGEPAGWFTYHLGLDETALAAAWLEKAIEQRATLAPFILPNCYGGLRLKSSPYWPPLARKMNLPEATL